MRALIGRRSPGRALSVLACVLAPALAAAGCATDDALPTQEAQAEVGNFPDLNQLTQISDGNGACWDQPTGVSWLQGFRCHTGTNQLWKVEQVATNRYRIHSGVDYGQCLDVPSSNAVSGQAVQMYPCHTGTNQQWTITAQSTSTARIQSALSGAVCLDVQQGVTPQRLQLFGCHGGTSQSFKFRTRLGGSTTSSCTGNISYGSTLVPPGALMSFPAFGAFTMQCAAAGGWTATARCPTTTTWVVVDRTGGIGAAPYACFLQ